MIIYDALGVWYHLYNFKTVKNTHGVALASNFTRSNTPPWVFSGFLNCTNDTKLCKASLLSNLLKTNSKFWIRFNENPMIVSNAYKDFAPNLNFMNNKLFYLSPNLTCNSQKGQSLCSFPKHNKIWKENIDVPWGRQMGLIACLKHKAYKIAIKIHTFHEKVAIRSSI